MPNLPISGLPLAAALTGAEETPMAQAGTTVRQALATVFATVPFTTTGGTQPRTLAARSAEALSPLDYMAPALQAAVIDGTNLADTAPAISAAIAAASAKPNGGTVDGGGYRYVLLTSVSAMSNVALQNLTLVPMGAASMAAINYDGAITFGTALTVNAAKDARTVTVGAAGGIALGSILRFITTAPASGQAHDWMTKVVLIAGLNITMADPMPIAVGAADVQSVGVIGTNLVNFTLQDCLLVNLNTGPTTHGVRLVYTDNLTIRRCRATGFTNGAAFIPFFGIGTTFEDVFTTNCGDAANSAQYFGSQSSLRANNLRSYADNGFGIQFITGAYQAASNLVCASSGLATTGVGEGGRGIKIHSCLGSVFSNIISNNNAFTGLAISNETKDCLFINVQVHRNGWSIASEGLWFSGEFNANNTVVGFDGSTNTDYDIAINAGDTGNRIYNARATNIRDLGAGNGISGTIGGVDTVCTKPVAVAALPAPVIVGSGVRAFVSDAAALVFGGVVAGGGALASPVFCDGAAWRAG